MVLVVIVCSTTVLGVDIHSDGLRAQTLPTLFEVLSVTLLNEVLGFVEVY